MESYTVKPALCLDLDGTVRRSKSGNKFIQGPDDVELIPGVEENIWGFKEKGYHICAVTNQAGVAHGFKADYQVMQELEATFKLFGEYDPFDDLAFCMMDGKGTVFPYNYRSLRRKPDIGMLVVIELRANAKFEVIIDWNNSIMVGDRHEDEQLAENAGIKFYHINDFLNYSVDEMLPVQNE